MNKINKLEWKQQESIIMVNKNVITVDIYFTQMKMILNNLYAISVLNMQ
ncbi:Uncharacterised protein [Mycobacteroides abscessus]|nr:Uncharacterised protein [Mycobacteroides abscessus]